MISAGEYFLICIAIGSLFLAGVYLIDRKMTPGDVAGSDTGAPEGDDRSPFRRPTDLGRD